MDIQPSVSLYTPTTPTLRYTKTPTLALTDTPTIFTSTPVLTPTYTPTLTATITPTNTITIPRSVKNKQYWAIVSKDRAAFWFLLNPEITDCTWFKAPTDRIEFEWGVEFLANQKPFSTYTAAAILTNHNEKPPKQGSIDDLLKDCGTGIWENDFRGYMMKLNRENTVSVSYFAGGVLIELNDPEIISSLFNAHPATVLFITRSYFNIIPNRKVDVTVTYQ